VLEHLHSVEMQTEPKLQMVEKEEGVPTQKKDRYLNR